MTATAQILGFPHPVDGQSCGEKPNVSRRKYLSPDEARLVIDAAGRIGRQRERDQLLLTMMYRHGLRVSEAVDLRWTDFDLNASRDRPFWVRRVKGSRTTTHTLEPDTARLLARAKKRADRIYGVPIGARRQAVDRRCPGDLRAGGPSGWFRVSGKAAHVSSCCRLCAG